MSTPMRNLWTIEEYYAAEEDAPVRHEFIGGHIRAMTGGTIPHARMIKNLVVAIEPAARAKGCETFVSDARLRIGDTAGYYPDLMVCCDADDNDDRYRTSPCLVIEVPSPSTTDKDQGEKLGMYELLPSLQAYLIVDPVRPIIEGHFRTKPNGRWKREQFGPTDYIALPCPEGVVLAVDDFYN
jgi:Uma2 family endonuclease